MICQIYPPSITKAAKRIDRGISYLFDGQSEYHSGVMNSVPALVEVCKTLGMVEMAIGFWQFFFDRLLEIRCEVSKGKDFGKWICECCFFFGLEAEWIMYWMGGLLWNDIF